jgi:ABC-2 type transport system permease protein
MKKTVSNGEVLLAILKKDVKVYSRNMIYLFLTVLSLVFFVVIFWLVPDTVDEELTFAISPSLEDIFSEGKASLLAQGAPEDVIGELAEVEAAFKEEGLVLVELENEAMLRRVVSGELEVYRTDQGRFIVHDPESEEKKPADAKKINLDIGILFPPSFLGDTVMGQKPTVTVFADAAIPEELRGAMQGFIREMAYELAGYDLPVEAPAEDTVILGTDRMGDQISMRARMRPLIAFFIMMMETFALASLISNEVLQRTVTALLVTPMRVWHFLMAKTLFGTALAMVQAVIILLFVGAFNAANWLLLLVIVLLGSLLFTAVAMFVGSAGKDFIGQLMYSMLFIIPLMIPSFAVLFPGTVATWVSFLPSYPIVRLLYDVTIHELLWADTINYLFYALLWVLILYGAGLFVLKRKVATL